MRYRAWTFAAALAALMTVGAGELLAQRADARSDSLPVRRALARQLYGDVGFEIWSSIGGGLHIGAADGRRSVTITVLARDLARWADSADRVLAARPPSGSAGSGRGESRWQATLTEPGVQSGSMVLTRTVAAGRTTISLLVTSNEFESVRAVLEPAEARTLVAAVRRALRAVEGRK